MRIVFFFHFGHCNGSFGSFAGTGKSACPYAVSSPSTARRFTVPGIASSWAWLFECQRCSDVTSELTSLTCVRDGLRVPSLLVALTKDKQRRDKEEVKTEVSLRIDGGSQTTPFRHDSTVAQDELQFPQELLVYRINHILVDAHAGTTDRRQVHACRRDPYAHGEGREMHHADQPQTPSSFGRFRLGNSRWYDSRQVALLEHTKCYVL